MTKKFMIVKKHLLYSFYIALATSIIAACSSGKTEESDNLSNAIALPVASIDTSTATIVNSYHGKIEGKINVEVRPQIEGQLQDIYVDEGDFVEKGQTLFKIDPSAYQEKLNNMIANENVAKAKLENANLEVERLKPLVENDVISEVKLKSAQSDYEVAKASLAQATAEVRSAEIDKEYTLIKAPVSGYIARIPKRVGNLVSESDSDPLTYLSDVEEVYIYFTMSESDFLYYTKKKAKQDSIRGNINNLRDNFKFPKVTLVLADGSEYDEKGTVDAISGQVDRSTGSVSLRATFPNKKNMLRTGSTGTLKISETLEGVIQVPQIATSDLQDKTFVYVLDEENKVRKQNIVIDDKSKDQYIIKEGLKIGDKVVLSGFDKLTDGSKITPLMQNN
ncbi:MAG TPA: efflux RND transporter periplasmic adaptor subunit [Sphingobacterium sp.]|nr:efflux RND transporter periplasmic adaptor subunit [Sphingobacterium sp.]